MDLLTILAIRYYPKGRPDMVCFYTTDRLLDWTLAN